MNHITRPFLPSRRKQTIPGANPYSKVSSLNSRLPLHYIILLDQEHLTMETWCGITVRLLSRNGTHIENKPNIYSNHPTRFSLFYSIIHTRNIPQPKNDCAFQDTSIPFLNFMQAPGNTTKILKKWGHTSIGSSCYGEKKTLPESHMDVSCWKVQRYRSQIIYKYIIHFLDNSSGILTRFPFVNHLFFTQESFIRY